MYILKLFGRNIHPNKYAIICDNLKYSVSKYDKYLQINNKNKPEWIITCWRLINATTTKWNVHIFVIFILFYKIPMCESQHFLKPLKPNGHQIGIPKKMSHLHTNTNKILSS